MINSLRSTKGPVTPKKTTVITPASTTLTQQQHDQRYAWLFLGHR